MRFGKTITTGAMIVIAAISLGGTGVSSAAPAPAAEVNPAAVGVLAVNNLGLNHDEAGSVQVFLVSRKYNPGKIDGQLGTSSWLAMQHYLHDFKYGYNGSYDGIVGSQTIKALQRRLAQGFGYTGAIDGIAGPGTKAAFKRFAREWT